MIDVTKVLWELFLSFGGAVGFSLFFNVPKKRILPAALGGVLCWGIYLFCRSLLDLDILASSFFASAGTFWYAEILARFLSTPAILLFTPASVPLIPGSGLYYTMSFVVRREWDAALGKGWETAQCALGIALGMSIVCAIYDAKRTYLFKGTPVSDQKK